MRRSWALPFSWAIPLFLGGALLAAPAMAQSAPAANPTPAQIQRMIAGGEPGQAVKALNNVLAVHAKSGVAWYLLAEAYDAQGDEADARPALKMAAQYSPGLPFANKRDLAALRAHIAHGQPHAGSGGHTALLVIGGLVLLLVVLGFMRRRNLAARNDGYMQPQPGMPPYGGYGSGAPPYGGYGYGPRPGGGGMGSALLGGLAAGAGFAAGERIIDGMMGGRNEGFPQDNGGFPQDGGANPDDGLMGNPGWDDGGGSDDLSNSDWS